jgi:hypothetical protein
MRIFNRELVLQIVSLSTSPPSNHPKHDYRALAKQDDDWYLWSSHNYMEFGYGGTVIQHCEMLKYSYLINFVYTQPTKNRKIISTSS